MAKVILVLVPLISICSMILANSMIIDKTASKNDASSTTSTDQASIKALDINMMDIMNACNESFRIEMSYLETFNKSGSFPDEVDKTPKCYIRCVLEKTGIASEDGAFDAELTAIAFGGQRAGQPVEDLEDLAALCVNRHELCKCERSYNYMKCIMTLVIDKYDGEQN